MMEIIPFLRRQLRKYMVSLVAQQDPPTLEDLYRRGRFQFIPGTLQIMGVLYRLFRRWEAKSEADSHKKERRNVIYRLLVSASRISVPRLCWFVPGPVSRSLVQY